MPLSSSRRSELRSLAHKLSPVVIIGDKGLTDEVLAEIDRSLKAHELIKVRAATDDRGARGAWMHAICERLDAQPVQQIGKVLVVYRENFDKPREKKLDPGPSPRRGARDDKTKRPADKTRRPADKTTRPAGKTRRPAGKTRRRDDKTAVKRIVRPRSRTPSPLPESVPRRRRPRSSR